MASARGLCRADIPRPPLVVERKTETVMIDSGDPDDQAQDLGATVSVLVFMAFLIFSVLFSAWSCSKITGGPSKGYDYGLETQLRSWRPRPPPKGLKHHCPISLSVLWTANFLVAPVSDPIQDPPPFCVSDPCPLYHCLLCVLRACPQWLIVGPQPCPQTYNGAIK